MSWERDQTPDDGSSIAFSAKTMGTLCRMLSHIAGFYISFAPENYYASGGYATNFGGTRQHDRTTRSVQLFEETLCR